MPGLENYKPVKQRIHEFREAEPDWSIYTTLERPDEQHWLSRCIIRDSEDRVIATGHAYEKALKPFDAEKAETSAVGRALVFAGWTDSLELSQEERERSEGVTEQRNVSTPPSPPQPVDRGPVTPQTIRQQPPLRSHPNPNPPPIEDILRLERPVATAPKGFWREFVKELVAADAHEGSQIPWRELTGGKGFDELTTKELKSLVEGVDKWLHSEDGLL